VDVRSVDAAESPTAPGLTAIGSALQRRQVMSSASTTASLILGQHEDQEDISSVEAHDPSPSRPKEEVPNEHLEVLSQAVSTTLPPRFKLPLD
jgi:hypothetical protein